MWLKAHTDGDLGAFVCTLLGFSGGLFGSEHGDLGQEARTAGPPQTPGNSRVVGQLPEASAHGTGKGHVGAVHGAHGGHLAEDRAGVGARLGFLMCLWAGPGVLALQML